MKNWQIPYYGWSDQGDSEPGRKLHKLILEAICPLKSMSVDPILLGLIEKPSVKKDHAPQYVYEFQCGPRYWQTYPLSHARQVPYERTLYEAAKFLKDHVWHEPAIELLQATFPDSPWSGRHLIHLVISFQRDGSKLAIQNQSDGVVVAYAISDDKLTLLGRAKNRVPNEYPRIYRTPIFPDQGTISSPRGNGIESLRAEILWRFTTRLDDGLEVLLLEATKKIVKIGSDVALMHNKMRFNDAGEDEHWLGVRVDEHYWENGLYFQNDAAALASAPDAINQAIALLNHLVAANFGRKFSQSFGPSISDGHTIGLFSQKGECFLTYGHPNGHEGAAYKVDNQTGRLQFVGVSHRIDEQLRPHLVRLKDGVQQKTIRPALSWMPIEEWLQRIATNRTTGIDPCFPSLDGIDYHSYLPNQ